MRATSCFAAVRLYQLLCNRQSQPAPPKFASRGAIGLREGFQDGLVLLDRDADPGVAHRQVQEEGLSARRGPAAIRLGAFHLDHHLPVHSELDGIADQIDQDLAQAAGIAQHAVGDLGVHLGAHGHPLVVRLHGQDVEGAPEALPQGKGERFERQFPHLDLGEIEDIVEEPQQGRSRVFDDGQVFALFR